MNEKIIVKYMEQLGISPWQVYPQDMAKFGELVIKETLQVARAGIEYGNGMEDAVYKYFGVEE